MSATIDKIRKLLNLANNASAAPNEAETARILAERLMNAAGISEADVATHPEEDPLATFGTTTSNHDGSMPFVPRERSKMGWESVIALAVARVAGCWCHGTHDGGYKWVGTAAQREAAIELHAWVVRQVELLTEGARKIAKSHPAGARAYLGAYRRGLASAIASQAMRLVQSRAASAAPNDPALVRRSAVARALDDYRREHGFKSEHGTSSYKTRAGAAYRAGVNDGASVRMRNDVGGSTVKRLGSG